MGVNSYTNRHLCKNIAFQMIQRNEAVRHSDYPSQPKQKIHTVCKVAKIMVSRKMDKLTLDIQPSVENAKP